MVWDFRQHLQADLDDVVGTAVGHRIHAGMRAVSDLPALVWRCTSLKRGEEVSGDDGTREAVVELVIWASTLAGCLAVRDLLVERYHAKPDDGSNSYEFGGSDDPDVDPLEIDSSRVSDEYDGDRVTDTYSLNGAVAVTVEVNFMWTV